MTELPSPQLLATLVSGVTDTMFGMSFNLSDEGKELPREEPPVWHRVVLPISGQWPLTVAIASDSQGANVLAHTMFSCPVDEVDGGMVNDALSELVNIIAGQVKGAMSDLQQTLGLPLVVDSIAAPAGKWRAATLKNDASHVVIWVAIIDRAV